MDHRSHPWTESSRHPHRVKDRGDHRYYYQDREQNYPPPDPRERERYWTHPDEPHRAHFSRPEYSHQYSVCNTQQYPYGYGPPEHQRPRSRHGYDYPPHSHWEYRENFYYDHDYYRGHQNAAQWLPQDSWKSVHHHERTQHSGNSHSEEHRYDQQRMNYYLSDYEENPSRENEEFSSSSYQPGTLASSKNSGLSSSSYELSQYINGTEQSDAVSDAEHQVLAPLKYTIPHAVVSFGPAGQILRVIPRLSSQENVSKVEIHSLEVILGETQEQLEMRNFPGPLTRKDLHKADAIEFAQQRAGDCMRDDTLHDKHSAALLWNIIILLCRQNGQIVGSDIAELLVQGSRSACCDSDAPTLIDLSEGLTSEVPPHKGDDLLTGNGSSSSPETSEQALQNYTGLLLAGRKKEALDAAMSSGLWGHALFLASKMDNRSYSTVLNRFTGQLTTSDPLQTLFQLLSGRIPTAATCCGNEKWGDWRPHLAVMLSNEAGNPTVQQKAIITMGDTLATRGLVHAAHVCYLTAAVSFGAFTQKTERLVLLGSSLRQSFRHFATNSAIQCTELYEYCQTLRSKSFSIPSFQVYKFLYASRLLDCGMTSQAFHYCELVGQAILRQEETFSVLTGEVIKLADRLRYSELSEAGRCGPEPDWLALLRMRHQSLQMGHCGYIETNLPHAERRSALVHQDNKVCSEFDLDDPGWDIQSADSERLYFRGPEDWENTLAQVEEKNYEMMASSLDNKGVQDWGPVVPAAVYANSLPPTDGSQHLSYHNTNSAQVSTARPHFLLNESATMGEQSSSGIDTMVGQMLQVDIGHQQQKQQTNPNSLSLEASEQSSTPSKQNTNTGWSRIQSKAAQLRLSLHLHPASVLLHLLPLALCACFHPSPPLLGSIPSPGKLASSWNRHAVNTTSLYLSITHTTNEERMSAANMNNRAKTDDTTWCEGEGRGSRPLSEKQPNTSPPPQI
ncbi:hypothetical protein LDENG_00017330 [Lucifuga dentata]|nr:hypothetical protein LDENG_00017330 [Lucifuga dentata]